MITIIAILHVFVCIFLILVVLLQSGRGSDIGAVFGGGGGQALFGSAGPGTFLGKVTAVVAVIFMLTALLLGTRIFQGTPSSVIEETVPPATQGAPATVPQEAPTVPSPATPEKAQE